MVFKSLIYCVFLLSGILVAAQESNKIAWSKDTLLTWEDFQGAADTNSQYFATTSSQITYSYKWDGVGAVEYEVNCFFVRSKSWKMDAHISPELLKHEQLHFDITELYARKIRQAMAKFCASKKYSASTSRELKKIFDELNKEKVKYEAQYDEETEHSIIKEKQDVWNLKIPKELDALAQFALKGN